MAVAFTKRVILALTFSFFFTSISSTSSLSSPSSTSSSNIDIIRIGFLVSSNQGKDGTLLKSYETEARDALAETTTWINERVNHDNKSHRSNPLELGNATRAVTLNSKPVSVFTGWEDPGNCDAINALGRTVKLYRKNVDVYVGPFCLESLRVVTLLGTFWKTPVITWSPLFRFPSQKKSGQSAISMFGAYEDFVQGVHLVLNNLKWDKIAIVYEQEHDLCTLLVEDAMRQNLFQAPETTVVDIFSVSQSNITFLDDRLDKIKRTTRTTVLCMTHRTLHDLLLKAEAMDMITGYYGFMYINFDSSPHAVPLTSFKSGKSTIGNILDKVLIQFGQFPNLNHGLSKMPVMAVSSGNESRLSSSDTSDKMEVMERFQLKPYFHDAVAYAIMAGRHRHLNEPIPKDFNASFLKTGPIQMDATGMRKPQFSLVHHREGNPVIIAKVTHTFDLVTMDSISWIKHSLPTSEFDCHSPYASCSNPSELIAGVVSAVVVTIALIVVAIILYHKFWKSKCGPETDWIVDDSEVLRKKLKSVAGNVFSNGTPSPGNHPKKKLCRMETRMTLGLGSLSSLDKNMLFAPVANYRGMVVVVKHVRWTQAQLLKREMIQDLKTLKEISHDNLCLFIGAHVSHIPGESYVLFRYCAKGSLQDVLENDDIKLDWMFKLSFLLDLARGMEYLHKSSLRSHGNLKSSNCVIDSRWVLKVTDYGAITSYKTTGKDTNVDEREFNLSLLWTAPELLRMPKRPYKGTQKADVYSFGIIVQEILLRCGPFFYNNTEPDDIVTLVKKEHTRRPYRPVMPASHDSPPKAIQLMASCWAEYPDTRPDFHSIWKKLLAFNGAKRFNILDNMLSLLESYSSNLEQLVAERTEELEAEKRKTDSLLYQMLPPSVAEQLKSGQHVIPESFENVSIFFSDIVGFTAMASESKPLEVVDVLNDLYTCFDDIIARRDVYKVETIGDAYMVVSGCPVRNGERHAGEIANMALDLVSAVSNFKIRHRPHNKLNLRVGLHTGPCAAGVVGRTMPRYCLFGDTVNMASRMESTGKALHIHMSSKMEKAISDLDWGFLTVDRGFIEVKGKGLQKTFWLVGKEHYNRPLPQAMLSLQKSASIEGDKSPAPSVSSLNVEDSMFSALRKSSVTSSSITLENFPTTPQKPDPVFHKINNIDIPNADTNTGNASTLARRKTLKRRFATTKSPSFADEMVTNDVADSLVHNDVSQLTGSGNDVDNEISSNNTPYKKDSACYSMSDHNSEPDLSKVETYQHVNLSQQNINSYNLLPKNSQKKKNPTIYLSKPPSGVSQCSSKLIEDCGSGGDGGSESKTHVHFSNNSSSQDTDNNNSTRVTSGILQQTNSDKESSSIQTVRHSDGIPRIEIS